MGEFLVWPVEDDRCDAECFKADEARGAVEQWAQQHDAGDGRYPIASGAVRELFVARADRAPLKFSVSGEFEPVYYVQFLPEPDQSLAPALESRDGGK